MTFPGAYPQQQYQQPVRCDELYLFSVLYLRTSKYHISAAGLRSVPDGSSAANAASAIPAAAGTADAARLQPAASSPAVEHYDAT